MVLCSRLDFTYASKMVVCVWVEYLQPTSRRKGTVLPDRDAVTFFRLKVTEISMFFIRLSINARQILFVNSLPLLLFIHFSSSSTHFLTKIAIMYIVYEN